MTEHRLPSLLKLKTEANRRSDYKGIFPKEKLPRLAESVISVDSDIFVELSCSFDYMNKAVAKGVATCQVTLLCMRCYKEFSYTLTAPLNLTPVYSDEMMSDLNDDYIPIMVNEFDECDILTAIEDELMVFIPLNPTMENEEDCQLSNEDFVFGDDFEEQETEKSLKNNPFAILETLKKSSK